MVETGVSWQKHVERPARNEHASVPEVLGVIPENFSESGTAALADLDVTS